MRKVRSEAERAARKAERAKRWREERRPIAEAIRAEVRALRRRPCMDCGGSFPPCCMDFDHRPGEAKVGEIGNLTAWASLQRVLEEIAKCDLVCANCHRIRTENRRLGGWF